MLSLLRNERGNWTLVGLLVALAVGLFIFVTVLMPMANPGKRAEKEGLITPKKNQTVVGASMDKGKETACSSNLRQIRMAIDQSKIENDQPPATLADLNLGSGITSCPVSGQPYKYDPGTGTVSCPTPGHEKL